MSTIGNAHSGGWVFFVMEQLVWWFGLRCPFWQHRWAIPAAMRPSHPILPHCPSFNLRGGVDATSHSDSAACCLLLGPLLLWRKGEIRRHWSVVGSPPPSVVFLCVVVCCKVSRWNHLGLLLAIVGVVGISVSGMQVFFLKNFHESSTFSL